MPSCPVQCPAPPKQEEFKWTPVIRCEWKYQPDLLVLSMKLEKVNETSFIFIDGGKKIGIDLLELELWKDRGNGDKIHGKITAVTLLKIAIKRNDFQGISAAIRDLEKLGFKFPLYN